MGPLQALVKRLFYPHHLHYRQFLDYVRQTCPGLTTYSIRYSAIHRLQELNFQPEQIALLSGHSERSKIPSLNRVYLATLPTHLDAVLAIQMSSALLSDLVVFKQ